MAKLGLEILSCNIQNITDQNGLINDLGADNTYKIKKDAAINKANAEKEIAIAQSDAKKAQSHIMQNNDISFLIVIKFAMIILFVVPVFYGFQSHNKPKGRFFWFAHCFR